jgi:hypothetical protein
VQRIIETNSTPTFSTDKENTMSERILTKQKSQSTVQERSQTSVSAEVDKVLIVSVAAFTGIVGLWVAACLVSAMYQAGGPLQLIGGWFRALSGM